MEEFKRNLVRKLKLRLLETPQFIQIVSGPRQTGKTILVQQACDEIYDKHKKAIHFCAIDSPEDSSINLSQILASTETVAAPKQPTIEWLVREWEFARSLCADEKYINHGCVLVLDEIQKIPQWSSAVKGLWDADRASRANLHVVLLGSAPLLIQQGLSESLAGRYEILASKHWSYAEMADAFNFDLDEYLYFGGYPGGASLIRDEPRWFSYLTKALIKPNIEKDILELKRVDKPKLLKQAFELCCEYSGQVLAYNSMLGQLTDAGNTTTLAGYMDSLYKAELIAGLQSYSGNKKRSRISKLKWNVMNTALMSCYSSYSFEEAKADRTYWGRLVESSVGAHLLNTVKASSKIYYWRDKGLEIDFVLQDGKHLLAIEVKSSKRQSPLKAFEKFTHEYKNARTLLVGADGVSLQEFFSYPAQYWLKE